MKLLVFVLNQEEYLESIMEAYLELNIGGATILDSVGMGSILTQDIPIFAGFKNLLKGSRTANKTILSVIPDNMVQPVVDAIEQVVGPLEKSGNGLVFVVDIDQIFGVSKAF